MFFYFMQILEYLDHLFWSYFAFVLILVLGGILSMRSKFFQITSLKENVTRFFSLTKNAEKSGRGIHPIKVLMASVGGMIGIGNIVGIVAAVKFGGPGALLWVWVAAIIGSVIKYSEIYLGLKYRVPNSSGGYDGGPLFYLKKVFKSSTIPTIVGVLLCIYGVEIYQFKVIVDAISINWNIAPILITFIFLVVVLFAGSGGVARVSKFCTWTIPFFLVTYIFMGFWIILQNFALLPSVLYTVFTSAFTGHAAIGGFAGSSILLAIQYGVSKAVYSGDLGIGYDSIIQSESNVKNPQDQAKLSIIGVFIDNFICTISVMIVLITGIWSSNTVEPSSMVQLSLSKIFPFMQIFMPVFLLVTGFTTIISYLCVGMKCACQIAPKHGKKIYFVYACCAFFFFSFHDQTKAALIMSVSSALLVILNLLGIFQLKEEILSDIPQSKKRSTISTSKVQ